MPAAALKLWPGVWPQLYRFTVPQYMQLAGDGFLGHDTRTELIEGLIVRRGRRSPAHDSTLSRLNRRFVLLLPDAWVSRTLSGLILRRSALDPDLAIVHGPGEKYRRRHPRAADTLLVLEVADASLEEDRQVKGALFAAARIPEYWIVNVVDFQVEVYTQPRGGKTPGYRQRQDYAGGTSVPLVLGGKEIVKLPVADVFGGLVAE